MPLAGLAALPVWLAGPACNDLTFLCCGGSRTFCPNFVHMRSVSCAVAALF